MSGLCLALAVSCSGGHDRAAPAPDGQTVQVAHLADGVIDLCQAAQEAKADPRAAKATYDRRARAAVDRTVRALQASYSRQASTLTKAAARVDADLAGDPPGAGLADSVGLLTGAMRESLALLGVATDACQS